MSLLSMYAVLKANVLYNMTRQVLREIEMGTDVAEEIEEMINYKSTEGRTIDVKEWWLVSNDFGYAARALGDVVVDTPFGVIWGREVTGRLMVLDAGLDSILCTISEM